MSNNFRLFTTDYSSDIYAISSSSENTLFPIENVINLNRRSKPWRSNGYFEIDATNKTLIFRETAGVDLTAVLTEWIYFSFDQLCTEIKAALEAVGASTYTVTHSAVTGLFTITSNGSGGGNIFQLYPTNGSDTFSTVIGLTANKTGALTYATDQVKCHTSDWILLDAGSAINPRAFIMCDDKFGGLTISSGATVKLQANSFNGWVTPPIDLTLVWDQNYITHFNDVGIGNYRYWRVKIIDPNNTLGFCQVGNILLGDFFDPTRGRVQYPLNQQWVDYSTKTITESGGKIIDKKNLTQMFDFKYLGLQIADVELLETFIGKVGISDTFFIVMDYANILSTTKRIGMYKFDRETTWSLIAKDLFEFPMSVIEEI